MRTKFRTVLAISIVAALVASLSAVSAGAADGGPPADFIAIADTLSQPDYPETVHETYHLAAHDGIELYMEVTRPDPEVYGDERFPVVFEASPYHGTIATRIGDRMFPDPTGPDGTPLGLVGYFAPRGYAVAMMNLRGTGRSQGCLDHLGQNDAKDLKLAVEWLADQAWSNGKVGMTGHSYVGSTPSAAAAQRPRGLATIIPSAGLASMYDHQFNKGVPWLLQWAGPQWAYPYLSVLRHMPDIGKEPVQNGATGDNFGNDMQYFGCGAAQSAFTSGSGQATGQYELWHAQRDHRKGAIDADIPIFMIHGVHDNAARIPAAEWFFDGRYMREGDKVWVGQWDHGSTNGRCGDTSNQRALHPTCRFSQMQYAIHAWFDKHLKGMDVDTGPAVEAFLNGRESITNLAQVRDPETWDTQVVTDTVWRRPAVRMGIHPDARGNQLLFEPPDGNGSASFTSVAGVLAQSGALRFTSEPLEEDTVFLGLPLMDLHASLSANQVTHLTATLYREDEDGLREPINFCGIQPQLRFGVHTIAPIVPRQEMKLPMQCFTMASWVGAGQSLVLEIAPKTPHHASFGSDPQVTVFTGPGKTHSLLPVKPNAVVYDDVPLREAPAPEAAPED